MKSWQAVLFILWNIVFFTQSPQFYIDEIHTNILAHIAFFSSGHASDKSEESRGRNYPFDDNIYFPAGPRLSVIDRRHR